MRNIHLKSHFNLHSLKANHSVADISYFRIINCNRNKFTRGTIEAIHIGKNKPPLNSNAVKVDTKCILEEILGIKHTTLYFLNHVGMCPLNLLIIVIGFGT